MLDLVAGGVLLVLGELDGGAVVRRAVQARQRALDDAARAQLEILQLGERERIQASHSLGTSLNCKRRK